MNKEKAHQLQELEAITRKIKATELRPKLAKLEWDEISTQGFETESGGPDDDSFARNLLEFDKQEMHLVEHFVEPKVAIPNWLKANLSRKKSANQMFLELMERVNRAPNKRGLLLAQSFMNDIGRKRGGSRYFKEYLNEELVEEYIKRTNPK